MDQRPPDETPCSRDDRAGHWLYILLCFIHVVHLQTRPSNLTESDIAKCSRGDSANDRKVGNILTNHRICSYHRVSANRDSWKNYGANADPAAGPKSYRPFV